MACPVQVVLRHSPTDAEGSAHRFDAGVEPRNLSRRSVAVKNAVSDTAMQLGLGRLQGCRRRRLVARGDSRLDLLDEASNAAHPRTVAERTARVAPDALLGGVMMRHVS